MNNTLMTVTEELLWGLLERLGPAALVEFTVFSASNLAVRSKPACMITSEGWVLFSRWISTSVSQRLVR
jgi:hypothetical protein